MADWFVSSLAGGGGIGSEVDPWTFAEGNTAWGDGTIGNTDTLWLKADGTYTTADTTWTANGSLDGKKVLSGYTAAIGDGGKATIQRSGGAGVLIAISSLYVEIQNLVINGQDGGTANLTANSGVFVKNVESHNAGTDGLSIVSNTYFAFFNCYAHDNGTRGIVCYNYGSAVYCIAKDNGAEGIYSTYQGIAFCISKGNTKANFQNIYGSIINCISDGGSDDGILINGFIASAINCIIINSPVGKHGIDVAGSASRAINCDFYNNDSDISDAARKFNCYSLDPQFNDAANLDYTRIGTNLDDKGFSEIGMLFDYNVDIGPDQKAGADYPAEADVEDGVTFDYGNKEGTFEAPAEDDVRNGVGFGADGVEYEGVLDLPAQGDVRLGIDYDNAGKIGSLDLPAEADVEKGVPFDGETKTGTFKEPGVGNVEKDVKYGADDVEFTGTFKAPDENQVQKSWGSGRTALSSPGRWRPLPPCRCPSLPR